MLTQNLFRHLTRQVFSPGTALRSKYRAFKALLAADQRVHEWMAELEEIRYGRARVDFARIEQCYAALSREVGRVVENLLVMNPLRHRELPEFFKKIDAYVRVMLSPPGISTAPPYTLAMSDIDADAASAAGGKAWQLALLGRAVGAPVPAGFVVTTSACHLFIEQNDLRGVIDDRLAGLDIHDPQRLQTASADLMQAVLEAPLPPAVAAAIDGSLRAAVSAGPPDRRFAVRSSAVGEDAGASFAGQYRTVLNVEASRVPEAYREVVASKYLPEALHYRISHGLRDLETPMAVLVLEMIDARAAGVIHTESMERPEDGLLEVHAVAGLGELLVQGEVSADVYRVEKGDPPTLVDRRAGGQDRKMVLSETHELRVEPISRREARGPVLDEGAVRTLAAWGAALEEHCGEPQDVEWCLDAAGTLFLLQSRPLKPWENPGAATECRYGEITAPLLVDGGERAASGVGAGRVFPVRRESDLDRVPENAVLVARTPASRYVRVMDRLSAVVTDTGGAAGHFASVAREFGVPLLVNTVDATARLKENTEVTVFADGGKVYAGSVAPLLENPCLRPNLMTDSPFEKTLEFVIGFVSPLRLVDPDAPRFTAGACRSLHDIVRYAHEMAVREMFAIGKRRTGRRMGARKLVSEIPMSIYVLDVGGGLTPAAEGAGEIRPEHVACEPFRAFWKGLSHPGIRWSRFSHFNWEAYDRIVMSGGIIGADSPQLASYAVLSDTYLNLNLKFGYHFVILDALCDGSAEGNHVLFRFAGGGADATGRSLRAGFLREVLDRLGFEVQRRGDLVDARRMNASPATVFAALDPLGRLLGATRLMDMYLKEGDPVASLAEAFMAGRYHFGGGEEDD